MSLTLQNDPSYFAAHHIPDSSMHHRRTPICQWVTALPRRTTSDKHSRRSSEGCENKHCPHYGICESRPNGVAACTCPRTCVPVSTEYSCVTVGTYVEESVVVSVRIPLYRPVSLADQYVCLCGDEEPSTRHPHNIA